MNESIIKVIDGGLEIWHEFEVGIFKRGAKYVVSWEDPSTQECPFIDGIHAVEFFLTKVKESDAKAVKSSKKRK
mgnify:FL=1